MAGHPNGAGFRVEPDAADQAAVRIAQAVVPLAERQAPWRTSTLSAEVVGHAGLAEALSAFTQAWADAVDAWTQRGATTATLLRAVARTYTNTDQASADAFATGDGPSRPERHQRTEPPRGTS